MDAKQYADAAMELKRSYSEYDRFIALVTDLSGNENEADKQTRLAETERKFSQQVYTELSARGMLANCLPFGAHILRASIADGRLCAEVMNKQLYCYGFTMRLDSIIYDHIEIKITVMPTEGWQTTSSIDLRLTSDVGTPIQTFWGNRQDVPARACVYALASASDKPGIIIADARREWFTSTDNQEWIVSLYGQVLNWMGLR